MYVRINWQHKNMFLFRTHYKESIYGSSTITSDKQTYIQFERQKKQRLILAKSAYYHITSTTKVTAKAYHS